MGGNKGLCSSYTVFMSFVDLETNDASGILSPECYLKWVSTRKSTLKQPEESFRRVLTAHVCGLIGRKPFPADVEASLLVCLRRKEVWPCFKGSAVTIGIKGFRKTGFHESRRGIFGSNAVFSSLSSSRPNFNTKQGTINNNNIDCMTQMNPSLMFSMRRDARRREEQDRQVFHDDHEESEYERERERERLRRLSEKSGATHTTHASLTSQSTQATVCDEETYEINRGLRERRRRVASGNGSGNECFLGVKRQASEVTLDPYQIFHTKEPNKRQRQQQTEQPDGNTEKQVRSQAANHFVPLQPLQTLPHQQKPVYYPWKGVGQNHGIVITGFQDVQVQPSTPTTSACTSNWPIA